MNLPKYAGPVLVELIDGRLVFNDAEEWARECEARSVLRMPWHEQTEYLFNVERARKPEGRARLEEAMRAIEESK